MTTDALRRLQALRGLTRVGSTHTVLAAVQGDLQAVIEAVLELADENAPPASQNGPQEARSADSGTGGPPEPENGAQGRIGWLRVYPEDDDRLLMQEVPDGWVDNEDDADPIWLRKNYPDAVFTPIRALADDEVAVKREEDIGPEHVHYLRAVAFDLDGDGEIDAAKIIRAYADALEAGEDA